MFFTNLTIYRLTKALALAADTFAERLADNRFTPCGSQDMARYGFVNPITGKPEGELHHLADGSVLVRVRLEEKLLPAGVIKERLDEKVAEVQLAQGRPVGRKEKQAMKEEIITDLLPRAFVKSRYTEAYISTRLGLVVVNTASPARAEEVLGLLRKSLGSLPVTPLTTATPVAVSLTEWLKTTPPAPLQIEDNAEFKSLLEEGGTIRTKKQALNDTEVSTILDNQRMVSKLAINVPDVATFTLDENLAIKGLKFADVLREENNDIDSTNRLARFDADFVLMARTLEHLIPQLLDALGGEADQLEAA